ncbi:MAG TPA: hypothetical protein VHR18_11765 [Solirubrobacterales bacterium]|nr:hypothetical protein [Solirubrobacterales bacterium]
MANRLDFSFEREGVPVDVRAQLGVNVDPAANGCPECARGFPVLEATIAPQSLGYQHLLGWIQLVQEPENGGGFHLDTLEMLGQVSHPFGFFGFAPTAFDAPHRDTFPDMDWICHSFLAGIAGIHLPFEARAILGFSWGYGIRDGEISTVGLSRLEAGAWDAHLPFLRDKCPDWAFAPGFAP